MISTLSRVSTADDLDLTPSIAVRGEYNDNIFLDSSDQSQIEDIIVTVSPGIDFLSRSRRHNARLDAKLGILRYADTDNLNATDQYYRGAAGYHFTERFNLSVNGRYVLDHRPDRDIILTGQRLGAEPRQNIFFGAETQLLTSETSSNQLRYSFDQTDYEDREFADSEVHAVDLIHTWNVSRFFARTIGRLSLGYAHADFETSEVDSFSGRIGAEWAATELWRISFDVGARYLVTEFLEVTPALTVEQATRKQWSGIGEANLNYNGQYSSGYIKFLHDIRESAGRGGTVQRTTLTGWLRRRMTDKFSATLFAGIYFNKNEAGTVALIPTDERTLRIRPGLRYDITPDLIAEAAYKWVYIENQRNNRDARQNVVFLQIYWQYPLFE